MCFLEFCFCFFDRDTIQKYNPRFLKTWEALCRLVRVKVPVFGVEDEDTVIFPDNHYALLKTAAEKSQRKDITENYLIINSYSTR
jgi:hypothetical protein